MAIDELKRAVDRLQLQDQGDHFDMVRLDEPSPDLGGSEWVPIWMTSPKFCEDHDETNCSKAYSCVDCRAWAKKYPKEAKRHGW